MHCQFSILSSGEAGLSLKNPVFSRKMSDFTETPHFNHNSVKGSRYTVSIKKKKRTTGTKGSKKKGSGDQNPGAGSFREFLRYKD